MKHPSKSHSLLKTTTLLATCLPAFSAFAGVSVFEPPLVVAPSSTAAAAPLNPVTPAITTPVTSSSAVTGKNLPTSSGLGAMGKIDASNDEVESIDRWLVALPTGGHQLCMAGVCLGDSIDALPTVSAARSGAKVAGRWHQGWPVASANAYMERMSRDDVSLAVFQQMRETVQACSAAALTGALKPRMRAIFVPDDATDGGVEIVAEVMPKSMSDDESTYAVTQIKMMIERVPAELSHEWPGRVATMWPGLQSMVIPATGLTAAKAMPERYGKWIAKEVYAEKAEFSKTKESMTAYQVEPELAVEIVKNDKAEKAAMASSLIPEQARDFNRKQWDGKAITHTLTWSHGISKMDLALAKQSGCSGKKMDAKP